MKIDEKNVSIDDILKLLGLYCQQKGKKYDLSIGAKGDNRVKISNEPVMFNFRAGGMINKKTLEKLFN